MNTWILTISKKKKESVKLAMFTIRIKTSKFPSLDSVRLSGCDAKTLEIGDQLFISNWSKINGGEVFQPFGHSILFEKIPLHKDAPSTDYTSLRVVAVTQDASDTLGLSEGTELSLITSKIIAQKLIPIS